MNSPLDSETYPAAYGPNGELQDYLKSVARELGASDNGEKKPPPDAKDGHQQAFMGAAEAFGLEVTGTPPDSDSRASAAIAALQPSLAASKATALENLYSRWCHPESEKKQRRRHDVAEAARKPLSILRQLITELATALQESMARENAAKIQAQFTAEYLRLVDDNRKLREFLFQNFEGELQQATSLNKPLLELVKELLLRPPQASKQFGPPVGYMQPLSRPPAGDGEPRG